MARNVSGLLAAVAMCVAGFPGETAAKERPDTKASGTNVARPSWLFPKPLALPVQTKKYGDLAEGPYNRLIIRNAMVIPGHGGPVGGPYEIVIEGNTIKSMTVLDPVSVGWGAKTQETKADRVIDATGMYVMPGMIDLHHHIRQDPLPMEYIYYLKLAHGVTSGVTSPDRGLTHLMDQAQKSANREILAPRIYPIWNWGHDLGYDQAFREDPKNAPRIAREMAARGMHVTRLMDETWSPELFAAITKSVWDVGGMTTIHLQPATNNVIDAVRAACLGVTQIEHHYGYPEAALDRKVQNFPRDYNYGDEVDRFRQAGEVWEEANATAKERLLGEVADQVVKCGATMVPTRAVYEANRDIIRATSLPWHAKYTHQKLWDWYMPDPVNHGGHHYNWTTDDEQSWHLTYRLWADLIYQFNKKGGRVGYGSDDAFIWATPGFSNVRELQLVRESGMHNLEILRSATYNGAQTLRSEKVGLVRPGFIADLILVDNNPAANFRFMYSFGDITIDKDKKMYRTKGIVHTIKDGIVTNNARLMEEVARMVKESKQNAPKTDIVRAPFLVE